MAKHRSRSTKAHTSWWQILLDFAMKCVHEWLPSLESTPPALRTTRDIGDRGEKIAERYLRKKGYTIVERNWWAPHRRGEIDLIASRGSVLVAVEVKSYPQGSLTPGEAFPHWKRRKIVYLIKQYVRLKKRFNCTQRVDLIVVEWGVGGTVENVDHIESVATEADIAKRGMRA